MPTRTDKKEPRQVLLLQALYFESLSRAGSLTDEEKRRLSRDLRYAKADHHFWELGFGGRPPRVRRILYTPLALVQGRSVIAVKIPGEPLPDRPQGGARDFVGYFPLHDPKRLLLAIDPSARESDIILAVRKVVRRIKKQSGKTRSSGGGQKRSISRMGEALRAYDEHHRIKNPLSSFELGARARTFRSIPNERKGKATEHFTLEDRGYKLLQLAKHMIDTARKGSSAWVAAFPCVNEEPFP